MRSNASTPYGPVRDAMQFCTYPASEPGPNEVLRKLRSRMPCTKMRVYETCLGIGDAPAAKTSSMTCPARTSAGATAYRIRIRHLMECRIPVVADVNVGASGMVAQPTNVILDRARPALQQSK